MIDGEVFSFLLAEVEQAREAFWKARDRFWTVAHNSDVSDPAGRDHLYAAIAEENAAMKAYSDATMRLNRFLLDGKIPDDVLAKLGKNKKPLTM